jgi:O-antigen/teichoic acid export membrane protein
MDFKKLATINLSVNAISTIIAIVLASCGFGVWILILRNISLDAFTLLFLYVVKRVPLSLSIYKDSFKQLFSYGIFVASANIVETLYSNILSFILGKKFSVKELGYYNQAHSLEQIPVYSITSILNQVFFPYLSKQQSDPKKMTSDLIKSIRVMSFCLYPLMFFLICFAKPIIIFLYSEKWLPAVPFFQILCVIGFTNFMYHLNRSVLKAIGKTKLLFILQISVCLTGLLLIVGAIPFGIYTVVIASVLNSTLAFIIIAFFTGRQIKLSVYQQIKTVLPNFLISAVVAVFIYWLFSLVDWHFIVVIALGFLSYALLYIIFQYLVGSASMKIVVSIVKDRIAHKNK